MPFNGVRMTTFAWQSESTHYVMLIAFGVDSVRRYWDCEVALLTQNMCIVRNWRTKAHILVCALVVFINNYMLKWLLFVIRSLECVSYTPKNWFAESVRAVHQYGLYKGAVENPPHSFVDTAVYVHTNRCWNVVSLYRICIECSFTFKGSMVKLMSVERATLSKIVNSSIASYQVLSVASYYTFTVHNTFTTHLQHISCNLWSGFISTNCKLALTLQINYDCKLTTCCERNTVTLDETDLEQKWPWTNVQMLPQQLRLKSTRRSIPTKSP